MQNKCQYKIASERHRQALSYFQFHGTRLGLYRHLSVYTAVRAEIVERLLFSSPFKSKHSTFSLLYVWLDAQQGVGFCFYSSSCRWLLLCAI